MEIGLHVSSFTWPGGTPALRDNLARIAATAEEQGFAKLSVMDHVWQIANIGPPEQEMLEAYTTLGFLAGRTERIELLAWVTAVVYRDPGLLVKAVTTLDVLSGGRLIVGVGAGHVPEEYNLLTGDFDQRGRHTLCLLSFTRQMKKSSHSVTTSYRGPYHADVPRQKR